MYLQTSPVVIDCPSNSRDLPGTTLRMTAKRYWTHDSAANDDGFSLLFAHCIGSHKEQWEPIIEQTFRMQHGKARHQCVREAWSFDWQSHGDAGVLNRELLESTRADGVSAYEWAGAIAAFVRSPRMQGKRIVAVAHSAGAGAMLMSLKAIPLHHIPFLSLVLVEPTIATPELFNRAMAANVPTFVGATMMRRDRWRSRAEAAAWLKGRAPWKRWDSRVLQLFVDHALTDTPDGSGCVTLKCDRRQEALAFPDVHPHFDAAAELSRISCFVPVHLVWGTRSELVPKIVQDALSDAAEGRVAASITRIEGGHMLVQESPTRVAQAISNALDAIGVGVGIPVDHCIPVERSRL
ncbi:Alpha/Beta hydrolase protein [Mycena capillaripes]|nr:Alpha/Beta hydrolase protein [Mycena capillaripes]